MLFVAAAVASMSLHAQICSVRGFLNALAEFPEDKTMTQELQSPDGAGV